MIKLQEKLNPQVLSQCPTYSLCRKLPMHPASSLQAPHCQASGCQPLSHTQDFLFYKDF